MSISLLLKLSIFLALSLVINNSRASKGERQIVPDSIKMNITASIKQVYPNLAIHSITTSPITGIFKVKLKENKQILFASADGTYFISGDMYTLDDNKFVSLQRAERTIDLINTISLSDMIIYPAAGSALQHIYIFTDVDCPYCAKLHKEIPILNGQGIEVRYLAYPRAGLYSPSHSKISAAWCSETPLKLLPIIQQGQTVPIKDSCDTTAIDKQFTIGNKIGVTGTPTIVFSDGEMISGYHTAESIISKVLSKK